MPLHLLVKWGRWFLQIVDIHVGNFNMKLTGRWFPQIVDRDSGNLYPIYTYNKNCGVSFLTCSREISGDRVALFPLISRINVQSQHSFNERYRTKIKTSDRFIIISPVWMFTGILYHVYMVYSSLRSCLHRHFINSKSRYQIIFMSRAVVDWWAIIFPGYPSSHYNWT